MARDFVLSEDWQKPNLIALMDEALNFLVLKGVSGAVIPGFALLRFTELQQRTL